jgi:hypothetical protein
VGLVVANGQTDLVVLVIAVDARIIVPAGILELVGLAPDVDPSSVAIAG